MKKSNYISLFILAMSFTTQLQAQTTTSTPQQMVDALHQTFGKYPNARAVHAKGIITEGFFTPSPEAKKICKAVHFSIAKSPVTVRFSDFTGIPNISDTDAHSNPRGLAIKFHLPDGKTTDIVSHSYNGFPVATTDEFRELLTAISKSGSDSIKPTPLDTFLETHPVAKTFLTNQKPASVSFANLSYYGVNAFKFINSKGSAVYIRYQFIPEEGEKFLSQEALSQLGPNYLNEEIKSHLSSENIKFRLYAQIAQPGDTINNPSIVWPENRKRILLGTITLTKVTANTPAEDKKLSFIPNAVTDGIETADVMLEDRSKAYPISVKERQ